MQLNDLLERLQLDAASPKKRVLVVEDHLDLLVRLRRILVGLGHEVTDLVGAEVIEGKPGWIEGRFQSGHREPIELSGFDAALLDHYFVSSSMNGHVLTQELVRVGVGRILAMSSDAGANARMSKAGAQIALRKNIVLSLVQTDPK